MSNPLALVKALDEEGVKATFEPLERAFQHLDECLHLLHDKTGHLEKEDEEDLYANITYSLTELTKSKLVMWGMAGFAERVQAGEDGQSNSLN